jgi:hypothetical protein
MSAGRIPPSSSLIEAMRAIALARVATAGEAPATARPAGDAPLAASGAAELKRRMREAVQDVDVRDPTSLAKARAPVIRMILLSEFGPDFRQDAQFGPMVEAIEKTFDADPRFAAQFARLVAGLKKARP